MAKIKEIILLIVKLHSIDRVNFYLSAVLLVIVSFLEGLGLGLLIPIFDSILVPNNTDTPQGGFIQIATSAVNLVGLGNTSLVLSVIALVAFLLQAFAIVAQSRAFHRLLYTYELRLREEFLAAYMKADWLYLVSQDSGTIAAMVNGQVRYISESIYYLNWLLRSLLMVLVLGSVAFYLSPLLTFIIALGFFLSSVILRSRIKKTEDYGSKVIRSTEGISTQTLEILINAKSIKANSLEDEAQLKFKRWALDLASAQADARVNEDISRAVLQPVMFTALLVVLLLGVYVLHISVASLLVYLGVGYRLLPPLSYIHNQYQKVLVGLPALSSLQSMLHVISQRTTISNGSIIFEANKPFRLDIKNVCFKYNDNPILAGVCLQISEGERICIKGSSGAGKSTLVDLILGLIHPNSGEITINGVDLRNLDTTSWHKIIGYLGQDVILWNDSILNNITWGVRRQIERKEVIFWMENAGLASLLSRLDKGLDTLVGERGSLLSGGERQRLGLIRLLLKQPRFLLLDEATSALDVDSESRLIQLVHEYSEATGACVVSISHRPSWEETATRTYKMERGRLVLSNILTRATL
jgi:ATP-binding cassette, subfamily C, bacterial